MPDDANSIRSIAAQMVEKRPTPTEAAAPTGQEPVPVSHEADAPRGDEDEDQNLTPEGGSDAPEGEEWTGEDGGEGEGGDDEPVYRVKVAGEDREVTLSELLKSYSGEGAIAKRLQEATEARNEAERARDIAIEQERVAARETIQKEAEALRTQAQQLAAVYQHYGQALLAPQVELPDPQMQQTDPIRYLTQMEAYRQDQDRLRAQQAHMQEVVQQAEALEAQQRADFAREEVQRMIEEVPAMANPEYRKAQAGRVFEIGRAVGFTDAEIKKYATDRRVIYLAMLAAQGAEAIMGTRNGGKPTVTPKAGQPTSKPAMPRAANGTFKKKSEATVERAKSTGDYRDVAKTMLVRAPRSARPGQV